MAKQVVVPKDKHGILGYRESGIHYSEATGALEKKFGAARNFAPTSQEGEPEKIITFRRRMLVTFTS